MYRFMKFSIPVLALALLGPTASTNGLAQDSSCQAMGTDLNNAKEAYSAQCPNIPRVDCDPVGNGNWTCSSAQIGNRAPLLFDTSIAETQTPAPDPAPQIELPTNSASECVATGSNLTLAIDAYDASCMAPRVDCDPVSGGWSCSSGVIGNSAPSTRVSIGSGSSNTTSTPTTGSTTTSTQTNSGTTTSGNTYTGRVPQLSWKDSYSYQGVCYISGGYDHNAREQQVQLPDGSYAKVKDMLHLLAVGPGEQHADALYNDIQCGNGPANDAGDEDPDQCPGRVDQGRAGCQVIGPKWLYL